MDRIRDVHAESGFSVVFQIIVLLGVAGTLATGYAVVQNQENRRATVDRHLSRHARQLSLFNQAFQSFLVEQGDSLSDGTHTFTVGDLASRGYLHPNVSGTTPWGQTLTGVVKKNGSTVSALVTETGSIDSDRVGAVVETVTENQIRLIKERVVDTYQTSRPASGSVPGIAQGGSAYAPDGGFTNVDVSDYHSNSTPSVSLLINVDGIGKLGGSGGRSLDGREVILEYDDGSTETVTLQSP